MSLKPIPPPPTCGVEPVPNILVVAGEASGDMHGANLVRAFHRLCPEAQVSAMGGEALAAAGAEMVYRSDRMAVVGVVEVLSHLGEIRQALRCLRDFLRQRRPDLLVLIDYPDFNLLLAGEAKKLGIKVFYYISPQVWAWRRGRVKKIRRLVDRMAVILPFEKDFYQARGVAVEFVGHPLLDEIVTVQQHPDTGPSGDRARLEYTEYEAPGRGPLIGLLPGSRRREIAAMLPVFLAAARLLQERLPSAPRFVLPLAPGLEEAVLQEHGLAAAADLQLEVSRRDRHRVMASCDAVMAASGTVTLELAILGVPMVAAYRVSRLTYLLGRLLIDLPHATLVNLVAGRAVIPELLQQQATPEAISREIAGLLPGGGRRPAMLADLAQVTRLLGAPGASQRAAALALSLLSSR